MMGCTATQQPCDQLAACPGALVCQVGRCAAVEAVPVRPEAGRQVIAPVDAFYVDGDSRAGVATEVRAGGAVSGGALLLLRFEPSWSAEQLERAYLILEPTEGALAIEHPVELEVAPITEAWSSQNPWPLPRLGQPGARARAGFAPPRAVRIEVTELLRTWAQRRGTIFGLAVRAEGGRGVGARLGWEDAGGAGPRLDLYLR